MKNKVAYRWSNWQLDTAGVVAIMLFTAATYFLGVVPHLEGKDRVQELNAELSDQEGKARSMQADLKPLEAQAIKLQVEIGASTFRLDSASSLNDRLDQLAEMASAAELTLDGITPGEPKQMGKYAVVPMSFNATGRYRNCALFLHELKKQKPDTGVLSMVMQKPVADNISNVTFRLELAWYVQGESPRTTK